jgi:hypothetical protein
MAKAKQSKELRELVQRRKILSASLDLSDSLDVIAAKHKLTAPDVVELLQKHFNHALNVVLYKRI